MALLRDYYANMAAQMQAASNGLAQHFATHRPSSGANKEKIVADFLSKHLPSKFGIETGLLITSNGEFSNQADVIIVDHSYNAPLYGSYDSRLWPVESAFALVEVKSNLSPKELSDSVKKCVKFKKLERKFGDPTLPRISESLFVIFGFSSAEPKRLKTNIEAAIKDVPPEERPDLIIVLNKVVACCGQYLELTKLGQATSPYRTALMIQQGGPDLSSLLSNVEVLSLGENSLLVGLIYLDSWLRHAGSRQFDPINYLPLDMVFGQLV